MNWLLKKIFGSKNERDLKLMQPLVVKINEMEQAFQQLSDEQLQAKTDELRKRLAGGETLDDISCEAYAVVKNAARRLCGTQVNVCGHMLDWNMVHFDVQLIGGMAIHRGMIAEMATGEGKTLVATLPVYLNALEGKGVHVVTTSDYHSQRDSEWMGHLYEWLGLTVGCLKNQMPPPLRREMYLRDITYGTNSEFGFDYLRDNMAHRSKDMVQQKGHNFAIVDEIDSILIDEARTPLIISGPAPYSSTQYSELQPAVNRLVKRQLDLCTQKLKEAKTLLETGADDGQAGLLLYQVHQGMPKNKQLMHMIEDIQVRKLLEKTDMQMHSDTRREQARELRQELFFTIDEKGHDAGLTEKGCEELNPNDPEMYVLPDMVSALAELDGDNDLSPEEIMEQRRQIQEEFALRNERIHAVDQLIRAYSVYEKNVDYVVQNNQVVIVDENTGRLMEGRRWSDGLHQAVEAKEGVKIERETQTLATITIQNYFRMYKKLSGMTGTAETEADEFHQIYSLDVMVIPTNRPVRRLDLNDQIYKTQREKFRAVIGEIKAANRRKQPVLVGTVAVETSEILSRMLRREGIVHNVLNAKNHAREADIVSLAGQPGAVTIATNMAGRGTDIKLGEGVVYLKNEDIQSQMSLETKIDGSPLSKLLQEKPCGLYVIASERHESRRIDRQLRGRCARQGDPGISRFYVSLEDNLMRLFGSDRISAIMEKLGIEEGEVLEHPMLNRSIETAQRRVEQQNFSIRKRTLEYDDVMNKQREQIYGFRSDALTTDNIRQLLYDVLEEVIATRAEGSIEAKSEVAFRDFITWVNTTFPLGLQDKDLPEEKSVDSLVDLVLDRVKEAYELKAKHEDAEALKNLEQQLILQAIDEHWQEYLRNMDSLREGIGLRAYGQRDPLVEYKREAYTLFVDLMDRIYEEIASSIFRSATSMEAIQKFYQSLSVKSVHDQASAMAMAASQTQTASLTASAPPQARAPMGAPPPGMDVSKPQTPIRREMPKVGRNDPCPCGSGRKYKKCCGAES